MKPTLRSTLAALVLFALPTPALATGDQINLGWKAEDGELRLKTPVPIGSLCSPNMVLVPVTPSAVKAMKKLRLRLPPALPGGATQFTCQGSVYGTPTFCMVFALRKCVDD